MTDEEVASRAINWIRERLGDIGDLELLDAKAVWVTVYRAMEIGLEAEEGGGARALYKDALLGSGKLKLALQEAVLKLDFLQSMIPTIRESRNIVDSAILVETLKYGILDVTEKSIMRRAIERIFARIDPMYSQPVPPTVYSRQRTT